MGYPTVLLTDDERRLRDLLLDIAASINKKASAQDAPTEPLVLRWAGGWVRDKLLSIPSHDIDTAINTMTGEDFGRKLCEFCETPENIEKYLLAPADLGNLHTIKANPEKSKNLATATVRLFGVEIDFVNLRTEVYSDTSRNPQIQFGTPKEDALRRDATINALFYNLHTGQVEDFTSGISDLAAGLIRTPLEPLQTFTDDPLRVLRLVRFASRLGFRIDPQAETFMSDDRVMKALVVKISRERVGVEIEKMLQDSSPVRALRHIDRIGLYHAIFTVPSLEFTVRPELTTWNVAYEGLDHLSRALSHSSIYSTLVQSKEDAYFAWVLASLCPWDNFQDSHPESRKSKPALPMVVRVARDGLKVSNKLSDLILESYCHRVEIISMKEAILNKLPVSQERDTLAMAIRKWASRSRHWQIQVLYAILTEAMNNFNQWDAESPEILTFLEGWKLFLDHLDHLDIMDAPSVARLVDGKSLSKALGVKPGKWMGAALEICLAWQFRHPNDTDISGAVDEVRKKAKELGIPGLDQ